MFVAPYDTDRIKAITAVGIGLGEDSKVIDGKRTVHHILQKQFHRWTHFEILVLRIVPEESK